MKRSEQDPWEKLILRERELTDLHPFLLETLEEFKPPLQNVLVLGDASHVQVRHLLQMGAQYVVDVDSSPIVLKPEPEIDKSKVNLIHSTFADYAPPNDYFSFIYGKSTAFNPKDTTPNLLTNVKDSLTQDGIFAAYWAGPHDRFRSIRYELEKLLNLYEQAGMQVLKQQEINKARSQGLVSTKALHTYRITAKKY